MTLAIDVLVESSLWRALPDAENLARNAIKASIRACHKRYRDSSEVSVMLCDDARIRSLNKAWRGQDKATNVLSFPVNFIPGQPRILGDITIAFETMQREAEAEGKDLSDHCTHLVTHGFLHLLGFDHETATEAETMEALERVILARLGIADPYVASELVHAR